MADQNLPRVYLARHGQTEWSASGRHTGSRTDLPLTARGEQNAQKLGKRLAGLRFDAVFASPLQRARRTCELAGFADRCESDPDLVEWDYGEYEGLTTAQIHATRPDWNLFRDGCPAGESIDAISARADRVIACWRKMDADILACSSGHILRVIAARWLGLPASAGALLLLDTGSLSILSYDHDRSEPAVRLWNDVQHVVA